MYDPLVSIVVCTYNGSLYIEEQIESILNQTYKAIEVIIADDASTDNTYELLKRYTVDKRVQLYRNQENIGYNTNFSHACEKAKGTYIAISDQDDIWELDKIEVLVNAIKADPSYVLVHGISARFEQKGSPHLKSVKVKNHFEGNDIRGFYTTNPIPGHNMLFKASLLQKSLPFPTDVHYDRWLAANACVIGTIKAVNKILVWHRIHSTNATGAAKPKLAFYKQQQAALKSIIKINGINSEHRKIGEQLLHYYNELPYQRFSVPLFQLLLQNARSVFSYKKRRFPWISYIKHAFKLSMRSTKA